MKYLIIDGNIGGTGIRNKYDTGYLDPNSLGIDKEILLKLSAWLMKYHEEFFNDYKDKECIRLLDIEGENLSQMIKQSLNVEKIEYFSDATMQRKLI